MKKIISSFKEKNISISWQRIWVIVVAVFVLFALLFTGLIAYSKTYTNKALPGLYIGEIPIGGLDKNELKKLLQDMTDKMFTEGILFSFGEDIEDLTVYPIIVSESSSVELIEMDVDAEVESLLSFQKDGDILTKAVTTIFSRIRKPHVSLQHIMIDKKKIEEIIKNYIEPFESKQINASVDINSILPLDYEITSSSAGIAFQYQDVHGQIESAWSNLEQPKINIEKINIEPEIKENQLEEILPRLPQVFTNGGLELTYKDPHTRQNRSWFVSLEKIQKWLEAQRTDNNGLGFGLTASSTLDYLEKKISSVINIEAKEAKFEMGQNGKVTEFQGSRPGVELDLEKTYQSVNNAILQRSWHNEGVTATVTIVVKKTEPNLKTGNVNDLGIQDILGVGISNFSGSPANRIKNIKNAVNKLNGLLIKPGEEFSAIKYTKPYTLEGGYLPELVIKGDEIKPEIGGGLCQIGTTLFRMAMNSGMEITQRRNHSLVVSYYNDPINHLPGTDATIYEPAPDFRFKNDTENYVLLQTSVDVQKGELLFTLWGTSDGRDASFSNPVVHNWIKPSETRIVETTKLAPGEKKCQHAYTGANASFTYTRIFENGTEEKEVFESHYRPLPEICLLGIEEDVEEEKVECEEGDEECVIEIEVKIEE